MTETQTESVTFISKCHNQSVVIEPKDVEYDTRGVRVIKRIAGKSVEFENGKLTTDDPEVIEHIRSLAQFNAVDTRGIWELGNAPAEPKPTVAQQQKAIEAAVTEGDVDAIAEVVEVEKETHNRAVVLSTARVALASLSREADSHQESSRELPPAA